MKNEDVMNVSELSVISLIYAIWCQTDVFMISALHVSCKLHLIILKQTSTKYKPSSPLH